jgi:hypothetical protein
MPVSGLKRGERVTTPAGKRAIVVYAKSGRSPWATVEYSDGRRQRFAQSALRREQNV